MHRPMSKSALHSICNPPRRVRGLPPLGRWRKEFVPSRAERAGALRVDRPLRLDWGEDRVRCRLSSEGAGANESLGQSVVSKSRSRRGYASKTSEPPILISVIFGNLRSSLVIPGYSYHRALTARKIVSPRSRNGQEKIKHVKHGKVLQPA